MNNFQWRANARIIAYIDWCVSRVVLAIFCVFVFCGIVATVMILTDTWVPENINKSDMLWFFWMLLSSLGFPICVISLYYWSASLLLVATKLGADPATVVDKAHVWLSLHRIYFVLGILINLPFQKYGPLALAIFVRGYFLFSVRKYIEELEEACPVAREDA